MSKYIFVTTTNIIDRIPVGVAHLIAVPSQLQYGNCQLLSDNSVTIIPNEEFIINCHELSKFACALTYFESLDVSKDLIQKIEFENNDLCVEVKDKQKLFVLNTKDFSYNFHQSVSTLANAFYELALVPFCYTPLITKDLYTVLQNVTSDDLTMIKDNQLPNAFLDIRNLQTDYYHLHRLVCRHQNLFKALKDVSLINFQEVLTHTVTKDIVAST